MSLTNDPRDERLSEIVGEGPRKGQQRAYLVLSDEELAKGFVRPVRESYRHVLCRQKTTMSLKLAETYARDPTFYGGTFCAFCGKHFNLLNKDGLPNFKWTDDDEAVGS
jgi:hypothetical protein